MLKERTLVIDGSNYLYRCYHALIDLEVRTGDLKGKKSGAVKGVYTALRSIKKKFDYDRNVMVFDSCKSTHRKEIFSDYKANRKPTPDDLRFQKPYVLEIARCLGFNVLEATDAEGDDVIGTIALNEKNAGREVAVISTDKDFCQIVDSEIIVHDTLFHRVRNVTGIIEEFGIHPSKFIDYLTLIGDKADNIPGVPKIGKVTAVKLLSRYGDIDGVLNNRDDITGAIGESIRKSTKQIEITRKLVTIVTDLGIKETDFKNKPLEENKLKEILFEFNIVI